MSRPTIHDLELLLNSENSDPVEILPDGTVVGAPKRDYEAGWSDMKAMACHLLRMEGYDKLADMVDAIEKPPSAGSSFLDFHPKCYELADHFLDETATESERRALARHIQDTVNVWVRAAYDDEKKRR